MVENWSIKGEYLVACNCRVSPCPCITAGGDPTEGECFGMAVLSIGEGQLWRRRPVGAAGGVRGSYTRQHPRRQLRLRRVG